MSNVRYVNIIKVPLFRVALFKVTSDPFIKVSSDWVSMQAAASELEMAVQQSDGLEIEAVSQSLGPSFDALYTAGKRGSGKQPFTILVLSVELQYCTECLTMSHNVLSGGSKEKLHYICRRLLYYFPSPAQGFSRSLFIIGTWLYIQQNIVVTDSANGLLLKLRKIVFFFLTKTVILSQPFKSVSLRVFVSKRNTKNI